MTESTAHPKRRFNIWPLVPFIVIGVAVIPNTLKIMTAQWYPPHSVEARPWEASRSMDQQQAARQQFTAAGLDLVVDARRDGTLLLRLEQADEGHASSLRRVFIDCYRPDHPEWDRQVVWEDPSQPLDLSDLPPGAWVLTLSGSLADERIGHSVRVHHFAPSTAAAP